MKNNEESKSKPIDREIQIRLLQIMKNGTISKDDINWLSSKLGIEQDMVQVEIIDRREQID